MPEAEEGNRTEDGKIVQVRSNVACANKWCMCGQMARQMRTKDGDAENLCGMDPRWLGTGGENVITYDQA